MGYAMVRMLSFVIPQGYKANLEQIIATPFNRMTYTQAIDLLTDHVAVSVSVMTWLGFALCVCVCCL